MREACITAVRKAAGEIKLSDAEIQHIEDHIREAWAKESIQGRDFSAQPLGQRIKRVASRAKESFFSDRANNPLYEQLAQLKAVQAGEQGRISAVIHKLSHSATTGGSIEASIKGLKTKVSAQLSDFNQYGTKAWGFQNDIGAFDDLMLALRGGETPNIEAKKFAERIHDINKILLSEAEAVGLKFHHLENYTPQPTDYRKVSAVKKEDFLSKILPLLDHAEYRKRGVTNHASMVDFIGEVYETLASNGNNKIIESGGAVLPHASLGGNRRQVRQFHFTPEGAVQYMKMFGSEMTIDGLMNRSFDNLIRDISIARNFGTQPEEGFRWVLAQSVEADRKAIIESIEDIKKRRDALDHLRKKEKEAEITWDRLTKGRDTPYRGEELVNTAMSWQVATKLGSQVFYVPKEMIQTATLASQQVGFGWKEYIKEIKNNSPFSSKEQRDFHRHITIGLDHMASGLSHDLEMSTHNVANVFADKVMKLQGLHVLDNMSVRALSSTLQNYLGEITRGFKDLESLKNKIGKQSYRNLIKDHGFTERDFKILSMAEVEKFKGEGSYLTDSSIYAIDDTQIQDLLKPGENATRVKSDLANKYRTMIFSTVQEHARGSMGSTLQDTKWTSNKGGYGALLKLMGQFLTMPLSWARMHLWEIPNNRIEGVVSANVYRAKALALGIVGEELIRRTLIPLISGREPNFDFRDPTEYMKALLNGVLHYERFVPPSARSPADSALSLFGPAPSTALKFCYSTGKAIGKGFKDKGANQQALRSVKETFIPFQNLWYVRGAFNHFVMDECYEMINPGYKSRLQRRMQQRQQKEARKKRR